jgi:iron complex outermembrane receptor protein
VDLSEKWKAVASVRVARQRSEFAELRLANPDRERTVGAATPMLGVVFQPDHRWSVYGSYATSYDPQNVTAVDVNGENPFDPEQGRQFETGIKAELMEGKLDATLAGYHIRKENVLVAVGGGASQQIGEQRSRGFEFDLRLRPLGNWQTILGYAYTDAVVTEDRNPLIVGAPLVNQAKNAFNLWSRYDLASGAARGLGFGVGVIYRSDRPGSLPAPVVQTGTPQPGVPTSQAALHLPAYTRVDAGAYYVKDRYELTFRVNNVFDEIYYESAFNLVLITPGAPREATLSLRVRF